MANIKISDLTAASVAADGNEFEINEAGTSKKVTGTQIKAYVNSADGALASKNTVATADIDNLAVTTAKLAADAVDGTKIADDAIDSEHYAAGSIDAEHIATSAVTAPKVAGADGTSGQVLQSDGDGTMSFITLAASGGFSNMDVFTSSGTWTNPGTVEKVKVTVVGGGGAGGIVQSLNGAAGGGGAGGTAIEIIPFPSGTNVSVTVGGAGGTSSFGAYCSATGGAVGQTAPGNPYNDSIRAGGTGGSGSGGQLNITGMAGNPSSINNQSLSWASGPGGTSYLGGGGLGGGGKNNVENPVAPTPGGNYGGGGGGAESSQYSPNKTAGTGGLGVVVVEY